MTGMVLLVEDELFVALDVQDSIEEAGFGVDGPYITVESALSALRSASPVCAVLDVQLADGEVFPVADILQEAGVPVIFHSGHADASKLLQRYPEAMVCGKPCSPGKLTDSISRLVGNSAAYSATVTKRSGSAC